jgi:lysosomal acid lipase/cholesteryl ester hydrolase
MIMGHFPAGTSTKTVLHYVQLVKSGNFQKYDYGKTKNLEIYGEKEPPHYNLTAITAPVALYWGENDALGPPEVCKQ